LNIEEVVESDIGITSVLFELKLAKCSPSYMWETKITTKSWKLNVFS